jgi:1-acyl-sn-glycerol-3-phosphate acyltransferase
LACLDDSATAVVGRAHRIARWTAGGAVIVLGVVLSPLVRRLGAARRDRLIRLWTRSVARGFGVRVRVPAPVPSPTGLLVVANHVSWLDILLLAAARPGRMVAKKEIGGWPVIGRLAGRGGTLFIDRDRLRTLPDTVAEVAHVLRGSGAVAAFPEGSTWCGRRQGRFRPALFQAALDAGAGVQPVLIRYLLADGRPTTAPAFVGEDTLLDSVRRVVATRGLVAEVVALPVIPAGAHQERRSLARAAEAAVYSATGGPPPPLEERGHVERERAVAGVQ